MKMIKNYNQHNLEFILESILLESKLEISKKLLVLLNSIPNNKISGALINIEKEKPELSISQNYLDISDNKEEISFIRDIKAKQILGVEDIRWKTTDMTSERYLTHNRNSNDEYRNREIFNSLGYEPNPPNGEPAIPVSGTVGIIKSETISAISGKTYVLFAWDDKEICLNKSSLVSTDDRHNKVWTQFRNNIRIGRIVRAILNASKVKVTDQEIEEFVNLYKSTWDILNSAFLKFDIVKGKDIAYWYNIDNYASRSSQLGSSCMSQVDEDFFDIYVNNSDVCSMLILYSNSGQITDNKYKSSKIKGRALVWETEQGDTFMDRIYTNSDSDIDLFIQYADNQQWWHKTVQRTSTEFVVARNTEQKNANYTIKLTKARFNSYPYLDSLPFLSLSEKKLSNDKDSINAIYDLCSTGGGYDEL